MKLSLDPRVTKDYDRGQLVELMRDIQNTINALAEEQIDAHYKAYTAAPTTGEWKKGDRARNSNPSEAGGAGSKYVIEGWICVTSGTPGTWRECRVLTGN